MRGREDVGCQARARDARLTALRVRAPTTAGRLQKKRRIQRELEAKGSAGEEGLPGYSQGGGKAGGSDVQYLNDRRWSQGVATYDAHGYSSEQTRSAGKPGILGQNLGKASDGEGEVEAGGQAAVEAMPTDTPPAPMGLSGSGEPAAPLLAEGAAANGGGATDGNATGGGSEGGGGAADSGGGGGGGGAAGTAVTPDAGSAVNFLGVGITAAPTPLAPDAALATPTQGNYHDAVSSIIKHKGELPAAPETDPNAEAKGTKSGSKKSQKAKKPAAAKKAVVRRVASKGSGSANASAKATAAKGSAEKAKVGNTNHPAAAAAASAATSGAGFYSAVATSAANTPAHFHPQASGGSVVSVAGVKSVTASAAAGAKPKKTASRYAPRNSSVKLPDGAAKASSLIASFNAQSQPSSEADAEHVFGVARPTSMTNPELIEQELDKFIAKQGN